MNIFQMMTKVLFSSVFQYVN